MNLDKQKVDYGFALGFVISRQDRTLVLVFGKSEWTVTW